MLGENREGTEDVTGKKEGTKIKNWQPWNHRREPEILAGPDVKKK
jgi:hypothetical protein